MGEAIATAIAITKAKDAQLATRAIGHLEVVDQGSAMAKAEGTDIIVRA